MQTKVFPRVIALSLATLGMGTLVGTAHASNLGEMTVNSRLGQPFHATVDVPPGIRPDCVSLASDPGLEGMPQIVEGSIGMLMTPKQNRLEIRGRHAENSPATYLTLKNNCAQGESLRTYPVILDPANSETPVTSGFDMKTSYTLSQPEDRFIGIQNVQGARLSPNLLGKVWIASGVESIYRIARWMFPNDKNMRIRFYEKARELNPLLNRSNAPLPFKEGTRVQLPSAVDMGLEAAPIPQVAAMPASKPMEMKVSTSIASVKSDSVASTPRPSLPVVEGDVDAEILAMNARLKALEDEHRRLKAELQRRIDDMERKVQNLRNMLAQ